MNVSALTLRELMDGSRNFIDTVWEISLTEDSVFIVHDSMTPDLAETRRPYSELFHLYADTCVYPPDRARWDALLSWDALCGMAASGCREKKFEMRFRNGLFGFEWHEACLSLLTDSRGEPDRVLLLSRDANEVRRTKIVEAAVRTEYDYVVYIEADKNSYVMYASNRERAERRCRRWPATTTRGKWRNFTDAMCRKTSGTISRDGSGLTTSCRCWPVKANM